MKIYTVSLNFCCYCVVDNTKSLVMGCFSDFHAKETVFDIVDKVNS